MKRIIPLFLVSSLICSFLYICSSAVAVRTNAKDTFTALLIGFDESPSNTDVMCIASCDATRRTLNIIQIPRDTYFDYGDKKGKLNGLYSHERLRGKTHKDALQVLSDKISEALGIDIDGYVALTTDGLIETVDFLGGVEIPRQDVPEPLQDQFEGDEKNVLLSGKSAYEFVRYRKEYKRGDLERLDAQKTFLKAAFEKIKSRKDLFSLIKFVQNNKNIYLNFDRGALFLFFVGNRISGDFDFKIQTLSGKAIKTDSSWYYVVDKEKAQMQLFEYFPEKLGEFDPNNYFVYK